jgi:hypothetical protein
MGIAPELGSAMGVFDLYRAVRCQGDIRLSTHVM